MAAWFYAAFAVASEDTPAELAPAAAVLAGRVLEHGSGLPLAGAAVRCGDQATETDARGAFALLLPAGAAPVHVQAADHVGIALSETLRPGQRLEVVYRLERYTWDDEVLVYGEVRDEVARTVLSLDELRRVPGAFGDPIRALQSLPSVTRGPELSGDIVARGAEAFNTAAYVDQIRVPFVFHFFVGRSVIDPSFIEDIEFYPGAVPARYGDVSQAVINTRTRFDAAEPGVHGRVHIDPLEFGGSAAANLGQDWTLRVAARRAWIASIVNTALGIKDGLDGLTDPSYEPARLRLPYQDHQLRLVKDFGTDRFAVTVLHARDRFELVPERRDLDGDGLADPLPVPTGPYDPNVYIDSEFVRAQLRWDHGETASVWLVAGGDHQQNLVPDLGLVSQTALQQAAWRSGYYAAGSMFSVISSDRLRWNGGGEVTVQPGTLTAVLTETTTQATRIWAGPYAEAVWTPGKWRVTPGLRVSGHRLLDGVTWVPEPRLAVRRAINKRWSAVGYLGVLSQGPTLQQAGVGFAEGELSVTRAVQSTVGVEGRWPSGWGLDVALYETEMRDLVVRRDALTVAPQVGPDAPETPIAVLQEVPQYLNLDGRSFGIEVQVRALPREGVFGWVALAMGRSTRTWPDGSVTRADGDVPFNLMVVGGAPLGNRWTLSGRGQLSSGLVFDPLVGVFHPFSSSHEPYAGTPNGDRYPVYSRVDVRIDKTWVAPRARWTLYLDVYNLLNRHNPLYATYDWEYRDLDIQAYVPVLPTLGLEVSY